MQASDKGISLLIVVRPDDFEADHPHQPSITYHTANADIDPTVLMIDLQRWLQKILERSGVQLAWPHARAVLLGAAGESVVQSVSDPCDAEMLQNMVHNLGIGQSKEGAVLEFLGSSPDSSAVMHRLATSAAALIASHWILGLTEPAMDSTMLTRDGVLCSIKAAKVLHYTANRSAADRSLCYHHNSAPAFFGINNSHSSQQLVRIETLLFCSVLAGLARPWLPCLLHS